MTKQVKKENKEVAVKASTEVSSEFANMFDKGLQSSGDTMDAEDIRLAKLTLIQAMTKATFNTEGVAAGNYVNSIEKNYMGDELEIFVMSDQKLWQFDYEVKVNADGKLKKEYLTITDFGDCPKIRDNFNHANLPVSVNEKMAAKGIDFKQMVKPDLIYRFYILLVEEVKDGVAFPYIVDFKRSSAGEGNKLKNIFFKMRKTQRLPSYARVFKLGTDFVQGEWDYYVKTISTGRNITTDELGAVETWIRELQSNDSKYSVDESDAMDENEKQNIVEAEVVNNDDQPKF